MAPDSKPRAVLFATLFLLALIWGSSFILMKRGLEQFDSVEVAAYRMSSAMIVLLPIALRNLALIRGRFWPLFFAGLIGNAIPAFLFAHAQTEIPSSLTGMLNSVTSMFTFIVGVLFFRAKPYALQAIGALLALVGALGLIGFGHLTGLSTHGRYSMLVIAAAICYGFAINTVKRYLSDLRARHITALSFLLTMPFLLVYLLVFTDFVPQLASGPESWGALGYLTILGTVCTGFALILFNSLIRSTTAVFASTVVYLMPVVAIGWGVLDGETIEASQSIYLGLVLVGILLINLAPVWKLRR